MSTNYFENVFIILVLYFLSNFFSKKISNYRIISVKQLSCRSTSLWSFDSKFDDMEINRPMVKDKTQLFGIYEDILKPSDIDSTYLSESDTTAKSKASDIQSSDPSEIVMTKRNDGDQEIEIVETVDSFRFVVDANEFDTFIENSSKMNLRLDSASLNSIQAISDIFLNENFQYEFKKNGVRYQNDDGDDVIRLEVDDDVFEKLFDSDLNMNETQVENLDFQSNDIDNNMGTPFDHQKLQVAYDMLMNPHDSPIETFDKIYPVLPIQKYTREEFRNMNSYIDDILLSPYFKTKYENKAMFHHPVTLSKKYIKETFVGMLLIGGGLVFSIKIIDIMCQMLSRKLLQLWMKKRVFMKFFLLFFSIFSIATTTISFFFFNKSLRNQMLAN